MYLNMKLRKGVNRGRREKGEFGATIVDIEVLDIEEGKNKGLQSYCRWMMVIDLDPVMWPSLKMLER